MKSRYKEIEGSAYLQKDVLSGAIINTNEKEIERARIRKKQKMKRKEEEAELKTEVKQLRSDIAALTQLVKEMVE
jgi:hypothetical protein